MAKLGGGACGKLTEAEIRDFPSESPRAAMKRTALAGGTVSDIQLFLTDELGMFRDEAETLLRLVAHQLLDDRRR